MSVLAESAPPEASELLAHYRPLPGVYDEMVDSDGNLRPHWHDLLVALAALGSEELARRFAAADRYLSESGMFYRVYEDKDGAERGWPLTPIPLIIEPGEWERIALALVARAQLIE